MAGAIALGVFGIWLVVQSTAGRLGARVMSYRAPGAGVPTVSEAGYGNIEVGATRVDTPGGTPGQESAGGRTIGQLTPEQVARVALNVGLSPDAAVVAVAIAGRESNYNTLAHNPRPPDDSYGLWQINRLAHPQFSPEELRTAEGNARAMFKISTGGTNWGPWKMSGDPSTFLANTNVTRARQAVQAAMGGQ